MAVGDRELARIHILLEDTQEVDTTQRAGALDERGDSSPLLIHRATTQHLYLKGDILLLLEGTLLLPGDTLLLLGDTLHQADIHLGGVPSLPFGSGGLIGHRHQSDTGAEMVQGQTGEGTMMRTCCGGPCQGRGHYLSPAVSLNMKDQLTWSGSSVILQSTQGG